MKRFNVIISFQKHNQLYYFSYCIKGVIGVKISSSEEESSTSISLKANILSFGLEKVY